jgi:Peptidase_C39 like family
MIKKALLVAAFVAAVAGPAHAAQPLPVSFHTATAAGQKISMPAGTTSYTWTGQSFAPGIPITELVASWNASTPDGSWLRVEMQGVTDKGHVTKWYTMGIWTFDDDVIHRTSVGGQGDADGYVAIDTFFAKDHPLVSYTLRVTLNRTSAAVASPVVTKLGAVASDMPNQTPYIPSALGGAEGITLNVPQLSQEIHAGQYPEFDNGGEAWCSPTSTSMVVQYWGKGPSSADLAWVNPDYADPQVDYAARYTFDYHYDGAGNWPFNTAYAAHFGLDAFVTQLRSLTEAEQFIKAGIPLVASIAAEPNKLTGFLFRGTDGHLLVIVGFTRSGDVVVNDPAETSDATVRKVYNRTEFERAWLNATGGIVYVIRPASNALPPNTPGATPNW